MAPKYKNTPLYEYMGGVYLQSKRIDGSIEYCNSKTFRTLLESEKSPELFFDSMLEYRTYTLLGILVATLEKRYPWAKIKLIRQKKVGLFESNESYPKRLEHRIDFAVEIYLTRDSRCPHRVIYVESKGKIDERSQWILRLLEDRYNWISKGSYIMVFSELPKKFPLSFPRSIAVKESELSKRLLAKFAQIFCSEVTQ